MSNFWFGVQEDLLLDEEFIKSKPSDKLYYFSLLHELNLHEISYDGQFFKSDRHFAATLSYSEDAIRDARRKFQKLGWLDVTSGFRTNKGQHVATTYHSVKWKEIPKQNEGKRFIRFPHYDFAMMLEKLHQKHITHQDMVVYCYIVCWGELNGTMHRPFYFPKKELRKYTNIVKAVDCVKSLAAFPVFSKEGVFDFEDDYHRLRFKLRIAADPYEDENNRELFNKYLKRREERADTISSVKREKEVAKAKEKGIIIDSSQLVGFFKDLYKNYHGAKKYPDIQIGQEKKLVALAGEHGIENIISALRHYFEWDEQYVPNPTNSKYRTLSRFLNTSDIFLG